MVLASLLAVVPTTAAAAPRPVGDARLSDERTYTRTAGARREAIVRRSPYGAAKPVARLHHRTEDGFPEVYLLLREHVRANGRPWIRIRVPGRPSGGTGWVPADALGPASLTRWALTIDRRRLRARLAYAGRVRWSARVGIGRPGMATPAGRFWIRERFPVPAGTIYGPWAFGTSATPRCRSGRAAAWWASTARTSRRSSRAARRTAVCAFATATSAIWRATCRSGRRCASTEITPTE